MPTSSESSYISGPKGPLHATTVAVDGAGLLIVGPPGSGKSSLALQMMALGAKLVADDRTNIAETADGPPVASAPAPLSGLIEARGIGLLKAASAGRVRLRAVVDLAVAETDRLPPERTVRVAGCALPLIRRSEGPAFAAALVQYLRGGRVAP